MAVLEGTKALEKWCKSITSHYENVKIFNMTSCWRNGIGFCSIIHYFHPELIDITTLDPQSVFHNNHLAFTTADHYLGIPPLLNAQDMVESEFLDRISILTYLSQYYHTFNGAVTVSVRKRNTQKFPPDKNIKYDIPRDKCCHVCGENVFILQRLNIPGRLMHRTCFKCTFCHTQLNLANYREKESGAYFCDTCFPDTVTKKIIDNVSRDAVDDHTQKKEVGSINLSSNNEDNNFNVVAFHDFSDRSGDIQRNHENNVLNSHCNTSSSQSLILKDQHYTRENDSLTSIPSEISSSSDNVANSSIGITLDYDVILEESILLRSTDIVGESSVFKDMINKVEVFSFNSAKENSITNINSVSKNNAQLLLEDVDQHIIRPIIEKSNIHHDENIYPDNLNPFDDDDAETDVDLTLIPPPKPPRLEVHNTNPFSDNDEDENDNNVKNIAASQISVTPNRKKKRRAPLPPQCTNSDTKLTVPVPTLRSCRSVRSISPSSCMVMTSSKNSEMTHSASPPSPPHAKPRSIFTSANTNVLAEQARQLNEQDNHIRKSLHISHSLENDQSFMTNNTPYGTIPRKKRGPAPPRPIPPKREVKQLPKKVINDELYDLEVKQIELERQGVKLEQTIREVCDKSDALRREIDYDITDKDSLAPEAEDMVVQFFELVTKKNELCRRQIELVYMMRQQGLEEKQADLEHLIHGYMAKPRVTRTDSDVKREEVLIENLLGVVAERNKIVDCLEMERLRNFEEDDIHLGEFSALQIAPDDTKKKKKQKKEKNKKKTGSNEDSSDKDIDKSEVVVASPDNVSNKSVYSPTKKAVVLLSKNKIRKKIISAVNNMKTSQ